MTTIVRISLLSLILFATVPTPAAQPADLVLLGGKIVTLDAQERTAAALAVRGGRIVAVGTEDELKPLINGTTQIVRLEGRTVVPGFIESHCHAVGVAKGALEQTYVELTSIAGMQDWIRGQARELPAERWIEVPRNEITRLKERRFPTPAELDAACTTHPVLYNSVSNKWVLNTKGFERLGLLDPAAKLPDGEVLRDADGKPMLIRGGTKSIRQQIPAAPERSREEVLASLSQVIQQYNAVGITSIFERATDPQNLGFFREFREQNKLTVRVTGTFRFSAKSADAVEKFVAGLKLKPGEGDEWIKAGPLKITVDGGIHWGTTHLSEPYGPKRTAFYRLTNPEYRGEEYYTVAEMQTIFATAQRLGWQMSCHVTGDEGTLQVLDALGKVAAEFPDVKRRRFTLIHAYFPSPDIIRRCAELGVGVDTQGYLYSKDADFLADIYGPAWAARFIGLGDWVRGKIPVALNSDHMIGLDPNHAMNSFNPLLMLSIAVTRKSISGQVYGPQQKLSRLDALRTVTQWPAWLSFDENRLGTIEPGKLADLTIIDGDYLNCSDEDISRLKVWRTIVGGKTVYAAR